MLWNWGVIGIKCNFFWHNESLKFFSNTRMSMRKFWMLESEKKFETLGILKMCGFISNWPTLIYKFKYQHKWSAKKEHQQLSKTNKTRCHTFKKQLMPAKKATSVTCSKTSRINSTRMHAGQKSPSKSLAP